MQNNCREIPQKKHVAPTFWKQLKMPIFKFFFFFLICPFLSSCVCNACVGANTMIMEINQRETK